jgi:hypothetical protein
MPKEVLSEEKTTEIISELREQVKFLERREEILLNCVNEYANESYWTRGKTGFIDEYDHSADGYTIAQQALADLKALEEE